MSDPKPEAAGGPPSDWTSGTVTTVATRRVRTARRDDYEVWLHRLLADAANLDGFVGADIHPPPAAADPAIYTSVFRFDTVEQLQSFERSDLRRRYLDEVIDLVEADAVWDTHTGLEMWFTPPPGTVVAQPIRWRMALLLGTVVYLLVLVFGAIASALIGDWPQPLRLAAVIAVEITLMTYLLLPWLTRHLARWIYPTTRTTT